MTREEMIKKLADMDVVLENSGEYTNEDLKNLIDETKNARFEAKKNEEEKEMTRKDKLYSMTKRMLLEEAEKVGVKVNKKARNVEIADAILAYENKTEEEEMITEKIDLNNEKEIQYLDLEATFINGVEEPAIETEEPLPETTPEETTPAPKKERKPRTKKTFESLLADVPLLGCAAVHPNGKKRNAVHVTSKDGKRRVFGYDGAVIVVTRAEYLGDIPAEKRNYGWRVAPTRDNMIQIQKNYQTTLA